MDRAFEKANGFSLDESLARAKQNQRRLLRDWTIFCTEGVSAGFDTWQAIVDANGGKCLAWKGRPTHLTALKRAVGKSNDEVSQNQEEDEGDILYLISEPKKSEFKLWVKFRDLAKTHNMTPRIVRTEWLLFVAMAQYVHWDPSWELTEEIVNTEAKKSKK